MSFWSKIVAALAHGTIECVVSSMAALSICIPAAGAAVSGKYLIDYLSKKE